MNKPAATSAEQRFLAQIVTGDSADSTPSGVVQHLIDNDTEGIKSLLTCKREVGRALSMLQHTDYSPLLDAAERGKNDVLYATLEKLPDAILDVRRPCDGRTLLMLAAENGHARIVVNHHRVMREKCRARSAANEHTLFAYVPSISTAHTDCGAFCCDFESRWLNSVNATDNDGNTPLLLAVQNRHYLCARILLMFQANIYLKNRCGHSAFSLVSNLYPSSEIRELVLSCADSAL